MRFNHLLMISLLAITQAYAYDQDEIMREVEEIYENSRIYMDQADDFVDLKQYQYDGKHDVEIAEIKQQGDKLIQAYLQGEADQLKGLRTRDESNLFVLVSFSMPDSMIKQYMNEASKYKANVVIIGLVDNDFIQTQAKIREIAGETNKAGLLIDPNVFITYGVQSVPAILLTTGQYPCQASTCTSGSFDIIYGAVPIKYALESFEARGDLKKAAGSRLGAKS